MPLEIAAKLALTREEIAHVYQGGLLSVKVRTEEGEVSLEVSCQDAPPAQSTRIRFKNITAE
jgi:hypothetical protein